MEDAKVGGVEERLRRGSMVTQEEGDVEVTEEQHEDEWCLPSATSALHMGSTVPWNRQGERRRKG